MVKRIKRKLHDRSRGKFRQVNNKIEVKMKDQRVKKEDIIFEVKKTNEKKKKKNK